MRATINLTLLFILSIPTLLYSQSVVVCIKVDGVNLPPGKNAILCKRDTVELQVTNCAASPETNVTIYWRNIDVSPSTDSTDFLVSATKTGRWVAYIQNKTTSTIYTDTVFLNPPPAFGVTVNDFPIPSKCALEAETVTCTTTGTIVSYQWYEYSQYGITTKINGETNSSLTFIKKQTYYFVEVKDGNGCSEYDTSVLAPWRNGFLVDLGPSAGPDTITICEGIPVELKSISPVAFYNMGVPAIPPPLGIPYKYTVTRGPAGSQVTTDLTSMAYNNTQTIPPYNTIATAPSAPQIGMNKYVLQVGDYMGFNCTNADTLYVRVRPKPQFDYPDTTLCHNSSIVMVPLITDGNPVTGWSWAPSTGLTTTTTISPTVSGLSANQSYTITATNACGNNSATVLVKYNPPINISVSNDTTICQTPAGTANLSGSATGGTPGSTPPYLYSWTPTSTLSPLPANTSSTTANPLVTTVYSLTVADALNCTNSRDITVTVYAPSINIIASPQTINEDISTTLDAATATNTGFGFVWKTDTSAAVLTTATSLYLEYQGPDTTRYVVIVTDPSNGCINMDTVEVWSISNNTLMYVPNVFSPNAINDQNRTLKIYGDNLQPKGFKWLVYNKWGNLMYETTNLSEAQSQGWNGGTLAQEGVYTYVIVGKFKNGKDVKESSHYKGTFSLIK